MDSILELIGKPLIWPVAAVILGGVGYFWLQRTEENRVWLVCKWAISLAVFYYLFVKLGPTLSQGSRITGIFNALKIAVCGCILAVLWTGNLVNVFSRRVEALFTGGDEPVEPTPLYSMIESHRHQGRFKEAIAGIHGQLEKFPNDTRLHMTLAEVQAKDLGDLSAAQETIEAFCNEQEPPPEKIWLAYNSLADWHLDTAKDLPRACEALRTIMRRVPDTEQAQMAEHRLSRLEATKDLNPNLKPRIRIELKKGAEDIGLMKDPSALRRPEPDPEEQIGALALHLEQYPKDQEAREELARLYADHHGDIELAREQIDFLLHQPHQLARNIAKWLNLLADLQVRTGQSYEAVKETLERIIEMDPDAAAAAQAKQRLNRVRLEIKGRQQGPTMKMQPPSPDPE